MESPYIAHATNFSKVRLNTMIVWYAGTQHSISIPLDTLGGTDFHLAYSGYLAELDEMDDDGLPRHSPFKIYDAIENLVRTKCSPIFEAYAASETAERESLQARIQPPTLHVTFVKDACNVDDVIAKILVNFPNSYSWNTSRLALSNSDFTNSYGSGAAPTTAGELHMSTTVQKFKASELFMTRKATETALMQQVRTISGKRYFFKPRLDVMAPEFDREASVLTTIISHGLHRTLKVSPFQGLVVLDNGLVTGMLFDWLEGSPLAEYPDLQNPKSHQIWQEQVEAIVNGLHQHKIVWGDVNVHNIFIDVNADAWVIDFGGNYNAEFVDTELMETYEGDRQGVHRIFEEWLPTRTRASNRAKSLSPII